MVNTISSLPLSSQDYQISEVVQDVTSGYDTISDTDRTSSMISFISQNTQSAYISKKKSIFHYGDVKFYITTVYPISPPTGDIPVHIRPIINTLNIEVILINVLIYIINC